MRWSRSPASRWSAAPPTTMPRAAEEMLAKLDVPYLAAQPVEFQTLEEWEESERGLHPDRDHHDGRHPRTRRRQRLAWSSAAAPMRRPGRARHARRMPSAPPCWPPAWPSWWRCASTPKHERKVAIVLFNFPPNAGAIGTAAFLAVFESLFNTLTAMKADGYDVEVPASVDELRDAHPQGQCRALRLGCQCHPPHPRRRACAARDLPARDRGPVGPGSRPPADRRLVASTCWASGSAMCWSASSPPSATRATRCGCCSRRASRRPMPSPPSTATCARISRADAVLHFGTHGALEFMPGKQSGLSAQCWPDRLIGDLPNFYLYAANNPSEGTIAKRRVGRHAGQLSDAAAGPGRPLPRPRRPQGLDRPLARAGADGGASATTSPCSSRRRPRPWTWPQAEPEWDDPEAKVHALQQQILELEYTLIPHGLHVVGQPMDAEARRETDRQRCRSRHRHRPRGDGPAAVGRPRDRRACSARSTAASSARWRAAT